MANHKFSMTYKCGHEAAYDNSAYRTTGACPNCHRIASIFVSVGLTDPDLAKKVCDFAYTTPTGRLRPIVQTLAHLCTIAPEEVPKFAACTGQLYDWARDFLSGHKAKRELTGAAACAAEIRGIIKKEYPGVKARVTCSNFSMGNSVDIRLESEVTDVQWSSLETLAARRAYGRFDGMTDYSYNEYDKSVKQAKYVHVSRR